MRFGGTWQEMVTQHNWGSMKNETQHLDPLKWLRARGLIMKSEAARLQKFIDKTSNED